MSNNDKAAYGHYVALCAGEKMKPLSFEGWKSLINGDIPKESNNRSF